MFHEALSGIRILAGHIWKLASVADYANRYELTQYWVMGFMGLWEDYLWYCTTFIRICRIPFLLNLFQGPEGRERERAQVSICHVSRGSKKQSRNFRTLTDDGGRDGKRTNGRTIWRWLSLTAARNKIHIKPNTNSQQKITSVSGTEEETHIVHMYVDELKIM